MQKTSGRSNFQFKIANLRDGGTLPCIRSDGFLHFILPLFLFIFLLLFLIGCSDKKCSMLEPTSVVDIDESIIEQEQQIEIPTPAGSGAISFALNYGLKNLTRP